MIMVKNSVEVAQYAIPDPDSFRESVEYLGLLNVSLCPRLRLALHLAAGQA